VIESIKELVQKKNKIEAENKALKERFSNLEKKISSREERLRKVKLEKSRSAYVK
jgi:regulator of replication initiation timing